MTKTPYTRCFYVNQGRNRPKLEVQVVVHGSRTAVQKESRAKCEIVAFTRCFKEGDIAVVVHFAKGWITRGTVAHEAVHAASGVMARRGYMRLGMRFAASKCSDTEEKFASITGQIAGAMHQVIRMGRFAHRNG